MRVDRPSATGRALPLAEVWGFKRVISPPPCEQGGRSRVNDGLPSGNSLPGWNEHGDVADDPLLRGALTGLGERPAVRRRKVS